MFPNFANMAVMLDKSTGAMKQATAFPVPDDPICNISKYYEWVTERDGRTFICAWFNAIIYEFDLLKPDTVIPHRFTVSEQDYQRYLCGSVNVNYPDTTPLIDFILHDPFTGGNPATFFAKILPFGGGFSQAQQTVYAKENSNLNGTSGKVVFSTCKEILQKKWNMGGK
jgi:hypothetical protein